MISYFEKQLAEFDHSIHSLDDKEFSRWVDEAVEVLKSGHKIIVSGLGKNYRYEPKPIINFYKRYL